MADKSDKMQIKRDRFIRIAETRVNKLLDNFDSLGKCANKKNYRYDSEDVKKIFYELEKKLKEIKLLFQSFDNKKKRFKFNNSK